MDQWINGSGGICTWINTNGLSLDFLLFCIHLIYIYQKLESVHRLVTSLIQI